MKKLCAIILSVLMLLSMTACGAPAEEPAAPVEVPAEEVPAPVEAAPAGDASGEPSGEASGAPPAPTQTVVRAEPVELDLPEGAEYIAFTGDTHAEIPGYEGWILDILDAYGDQFTMLNFGGDICDKAWVEDTYAKFAAVLDSTMPGAYNVTTGNQEWKAGAPGATWDEMGEGYTRVGEVAATDTYRIFNLGAAQESMSLPQEDLDALADWLAAAPANIPLFVFSHYPIHLSMATATHSIPGTDHRVTENNAALIEILNQYPNVIFLWGHNHTFQDPRYGVIAPAGAKFTYDYANPTEKIEINFTSLAYGSFCRGDTYGLIAGILPTDEGIEVSLDYVDTNVPMTTKDSAVVTIATDGTVSVETTPGTGINTAEILAMSGFAADPNFEAELRG